MFSHFPLTLLLGLQFFVLGLAQAQVPKLDITRDQYLDKLEARHRSLSLELQEITGITFEVPQDVTVPQSVAQDKFNELPGPIVDKSPFESNASLSETDLQANDQNTSEESTVYETEVIPPRFLEDEIGKYFLQPFIGLSLIGKNLKVGVDVPTMDADLGYSLGFRAGRRWGNLEGEIHFGYLYNSYDGDFVDNSDYYAVSGMMEATRIGTRIGYGMPFGERGWYKGAVGFGFANRRHSVNVSINSLPLSSGGSSSESVFTYDFLAAIGYELGIGWDAILSYQLLAMSGFKEFDEVSIHLFELGLGKNF
ncbi:MAG: hypothetical protein CMI24_08660 [Opitutae bacterium]|nr:hypothetical protein [Opitutae bacterium]